MRRTKLMVLLLMLVLPLQYLERRMQGRVQARQKLGATHRAQSLTKAAHAEAL